MTDNMEGIAIRVRQKIDAAISALPRSAMGAVVPQPMNINVAYPEEYVHSFSVTGTSLAQRVIFDYFRQEVDNRLRRVGLCVQDLHIEWSYGLITREWNAEARVVPVSAPPVTYARKRKRSIEL